MRSHRKRTRRPTSESAAQRELEAALNRMFALAHAQFGDAIKSQWFYPADACPGCGRPIDAVIWEGREATSLNAFIHRKPGVLIGYMLCGRCGEQVMLASRSPFKKKTALHAVIERTLIEAYEQFMRSLDA